MAVRLEGAIKRYIAEKSADRKPYTFPLDQGEEKPPAGSTLLIGDTGVVYRWTGNEWWPQSPEGRAVEVAALGQQGNLRTRAARGNRGSEFR